MKLIANRFLEKDIRVRVDWINNPCIYSQMYFDYPANVNNTTEWFKSLGGRKNRIDFCFYSEDDICVGMSGIVDIDSSNHNAEFYIMINPELQGKGLGKIITKWTINYAFLKYALNKLFLFTDASNNPAIRIYESIGFVKEGVQRKHKFKDGQFKDRNMFSLLREEWIQLDWHVGTINLTFNAD